MALKLFEIEIGAHLAKPFYVVASDPSAAYDHLRSALDQADVYFRKERELQAIKLVAENVEYPDCGHRLLFAERVT